MKKTRFDIPEGTPVGKCQRCGAKVFWIKARPGKMRPVDPDGMIHFSTCKQAAGFRKKTRP